MRRTLLVPLVLSALGLCFSGYLSAVKLFSGSCALGETCPYFLGYPACWYGFGMYLAMFVVTAVAFLGGISGRRALQADLVVSGLGIVFAGSFAWQEFAAGQFTGALGLSTCVYGLLFYIAIFLVAALGLRKKVD